MPFIYFKPSLAPALNLRLFINFFKFCLTPAHYLRLPYISVFTVHRLYVMNDKRHKYHDMKFNPFHLCRGDVYNDVFH